MYLRMLEDCDKLVEQREKERQAKAQQEKQTEQTGPSTQSPSVPFIPGSQPTFDLGFDSLEVQSKAFQQQHSDDEETRKKDEKKKNKSIYLPTIPIYKKECEGRR